MESASSKVSAQPSANMSIQTERARTATRDSQNTISVTWLWYASTNLLTCSNQAFQILLGHIFSLDVLLAL